MGQPVPSMSSETCGSVEHGPIDELKQPDDVRDESYNLPKPFEWCTCDIDNDEEAHEIYQLLSENYVEDDDNMFRFDYSVPFFEVGSSASRFFEEVASWCPCEDE